MLILKIRDFVTSIFFLSHGLLSGTHHSHTSVPVPNSFNCLCSFEQHVFFFLKLCFLIFMYNEANITCDDDSKG